jgi:two-component system NtrC family sensor kinase
MVPNGLNTSWVYAVPPILGFIVLLGLSLITLLQSGRKRTNLLFAAICFLGSLLNADMVLVSMLRDEGLALVVDRVIHLFFVFSIPVYIGFVHAFLGIRDRKWLEVIAWAVSLSFLVIVPTGYYISGFQHYYFGRIARPGLLYHLFSVSAAFTVMYCLTLLYRAMRRTADNLRRNRIKYIFVGLGFSALLLFFSILPVCGVPIYPLGNFSFIPAVFLAYGLLKYDLLDIGALIRRGTVYFFMTGILTTVYLCVISLFHAFLFAPLGGDSFVVSLTLVLMMILLFNPIRERVQKLIDRLQDSDPVAQIMSLPEPSMCVPRPAIEQRGPAEELGKSSSARRWQRPGVHRLLAQGRQVDLPDVAEQRPFGTAPNCVEAGDISTRPG